MKYEIQRFFFYEHLPDFLQEISKPFCDLAFDLAEKLPENEETKAMLRKLLEAKDCAVRSIVPFVAKERTPFWVIEMNSPDGPLYYTGKIVKNVTQFHHSIHEAKHYATKIEALRDRSHFGVVDISKVTEHQIG